MERRTGGWGRGDCVGSVIVRKREDERGRGGGEGECGEVVRMAGRLVWW